MASKKAEISSQCSEVSDPLVSSDPKHEADTVKAADATKTSKQPSEVLSEKSSTSRSRSSLPPAEKLARLQDQKARLARKLIKWEKTFRDTHKRDRTMDDLKKFPEIEQLYKDYKGLKAYLERKTGRQSSTSLKQASSQAEPEPTRIHASEPVSSSQPIMHSSDDFSNTNTDAVSNTATDLIHTPSPTSALPEDNATDLKKLIEPTKSEKKASVTQPKPSLITKSLSYHAGVTEQDAFWNDVPKEEKVTSSQPITMSEEEAFWLEPRKTSRKKTPLWPISNPFSRTAKRRNSETDVDHDIPSRLLKSRKNRIEKQEPAEEKIEVSKTDFSLSDDKENIDPNTKQSSSPKSFEDPFADFPLGKDIVVLPHYRAPVRSPIGNQPSSDEHSPRLSYHFLRATVVRPYFVNPKVLAQAKKELEAGTYGQIRKPEIQDALVDDDIKQFRKDNYVSDDLIWEL
ncbi:hypothetical protein EC973_002410 [Apophysomyces ossiformis]|uniref:DNA replication regulator SLD2 n=1 Tax=Apophysomyces ossiformis TaxID=679940 RepID=A0A8H7EMX2_9FUNG|nr:hypothetical protein EC973_002410 [Apophysomyces ossiformis]